MTFSLRLVVLEVNDPTDEADRQARNGTLERGKLIIAAFVMVLLWGTIWVLFILPSLSPQFGQILYLTTQFLGWGAELRSF